MPIRRHTIIWTNVGKLLFVPLGTYVNEVEIKIYNVSIEKKIFTISPAKWQPFVSDQNALNVLTSIWGKRSFSCSKRIYITDDVLYSCASFVLPSVFMIECIFDVFIKINIFWINFEFGEWWPIGYFSPIDPLNLYPSYKVISGCAMHHETLKWFYGHAKIDISFDIHIVHNDIHGWSRKTPVCVFILHAI